MAKILIVGGAGFVGSYCCRKFLEEKDEVAVFDAFLNYMGKPQAEYEEQLSLRFSDLRERLTLIKGDVRDAAALAKAVAETAPDVVVYLAAIPDAKLCEKFPQEAFDTNTAGVAAIANAMRSSGLESKRLVFASSSYVYGNFEREPADEEHPTRPIDVYGGTKLAGEAITKSFASSFGFEWVVVRPSAVYGPGDSYNRVSKIFVENALAGKPLKLFNGGQMKLDFTYVSDAASAIVLAAKKEKAANQTFNITRGNARSIKEFAEIVAKNVPGTKIEMQEAEERIPQRGSLDNGKAKSILGFEPKHSIEDGIPKYILGIKEKKAVI
jgi:UDP-glucose 4-epimerase